MLNLQQFFQSYLVAYMFVVGIVLGSLAIVMVHHVSGGMWGLVIRRLLESSTRTIPLMALLFVPLALERSGRDPALGSSVLLTFTTDSMGVFIFLGLATLFFL